MDLNGDGYLDLLSGSWPGELFFFRGGPGRTFTAPVKLKNKNGKTINAGGGVRREVSNMILVGGDARVEETKKGKVIVYDGQRIAVPPGKQVVITGTASAIQATDWDGDGDYDLLVGEIGGNVYLVPNEGTPQAYAFGKERQLQAGGRPLRVEGDAGPFAADWDGDGDLDLLVGSGDGSVSLFRNNGTARAPVLAAAERLLTPVSMFSPVRTSTAPSRGIRSKVCAADWNGDGRLDLLVGDFNTQKSDRPRPTAAEEARYARIRKELAAADAQFLPLFEKLHGRSQVRDPKERETLQKKFQVARRRMSELRAQLPSEYENHGWVWLFLRKPAEATASRQ